MHGKRKSRVIRCIGFIFLVMIAAYMLILIRIGFATEDTEGLELRLCTSIENPFSSEEHSVLDFSNKQVISLGKFGFYKKIVVKEKIVVVQDVACPAEKEHYFGIYKDKYLSTPIEEVSFQYLYRDGGFEEGGEPTSYDETRYQIIILEPGTYYIGVYCRSPFSDKKVVIDNWYGYLCEETDLPEGQWVEYFVAEEDQENYFHFNAQKTGRIQIETNYNSGVVQLCDSKRNPISDGVIFDGASAEPIAFDVKENREYYLKIFGGHRLRTLDGSSDSMVPQTIRWEYERQY